MTTEKYDKISVRLLVKRWREEDGKSWYLTKRRGKNIAKKEEVEIPKTDKTENHYQEVIGYVEVEERSHLNTGTEYNFQDMMEKVNDRSKWFRTFADRLTERESEIVREVLQDQ